MSGKRTAGDAPLPGGDFRLFITRLGYQALMSLGLIENPLTGDRQIQLDNARLLMADLEMLLAKTEGNLESDEREHLEQLLRDLSKAIENAAVRAAAGAEAEAGADARAE